MIIICVYLLNREREPQILDYQTQQHKLFPLIATCFVYTEAAKWLFEKYNTVTSDLRRGDLGNLPEVPIYNAICTILSF